MTDERKPGENDWRDQPPEENDGQRDEGSQAQDVAEEAEKALRAGGVAPHRQLVALIRNCVFI